MAAKDVVIVTGGSRGVGAAVAVELGELGCRVVVNYHSRRDAAQEVVDRVRAAGGDAVAVGGDVRDAAQAQTVVATTVDEFGRLDALVCNAATPVTFRPFAELSFADLSTKVVDELAAAYQPVRSALPHLIAGGGGRLVFVSSDLSRHARVPGAIAHATAKSALNTFARYLAVEYGPHGITSNVVVPGYLRTDASAATATGDFEQRRAEAVPLRRVGVAEDVAPVIAWLAAGRAGYVTGAEVPVTGGLDVI
jgi:3-oxoacyl-[acyl-carrier protein] reductase